jgi:phenylacetate-coenzyme A ligase PaaK-like adenylate-forming protein
LRLVSSLGAALWREHFYDAAAFRAYSRRRLAALLRHARDHVPFYADRLVDVDLADPDITKIPPTEKIDLLDNFDDTIADGAVTFAQVRARIADRGADRPEIGSYVLSATSGSTGLVGYFVHDRDAWELTRGVLVARLLRHRLTPYQIARFSFGRRYRMAWLVATGGPYITYLLTQGAPAIASVWIRLARFSIMDAIDVTVDKLNAWRPHFLHGYPTFIEALAHEKLAGRLLASPEFISVASEQFTQMARVTLAEAFPNAFVTQTYGMTECLGIGNQCKEGRLHVNEDFAIVEPIDAFGRPVPVGQPSHKILVTNLVNRIQPIIRYEVSDSVTYTGEQCPCGVALPVIEVNGRADDVIFLEDRRGEFHAHPPIPFEVLFLEIEGLRQYQLIHENQNRLRVLYNVREGADPDVVETQLRRRFDVYLARHYLTGLVELTIERTEAIERSRRSQKLRQIVSRVPRPPRAASGGE